MEGIFKLDIYNSYAIIQGIFVAEVSHIEYLLKNKIEIYCGDIAGKYSEVKGYLTENEVSLVTTDPEVIKVFKKHSLHCGINPLDYQVLYEEEDEEDFKEGCFEKDKSEEYADYAKEFVEYRLSKEYLDLKK